MTNLLADDHSEVDLLLRDLWREFDRGATRAVFERLDYFWARLAVHIRAEHLHLFRVLLAATDGAKAAGAQSAPTREEVRDCVERLREDHDFFMHELAGAVNEARELASREGAEVGEALLRIRERVRGVAERLVEHNQVEEQKVYLWPAALFDEAALAELNREMKHEIENLPPRFSEAGPG